MTDPRDFHHPEELQPQDRRKPSIAFIIAYPVLLIVSLAFALIEAFDRKGPQQ